MTALFVSAARGLSRADAGGPLDPFARSLLPRVVGAGVSALEPLARSSVGRIALRAASLGLLTHIDLRTRAIDLALSSFVYEARSPQVLLLGAGADARGYRCPELAGVPLFEVDHPSTQAEKRARAARLEARAQITYVPVDFERDSLARSLREAGFDEQRPTFVLWEGVTMYLTEPALRATLRVLRDVLGPGSALAMTYVLPELSPTPSAARPLVRAAFALIGEPLRGLFTTPELRALLASEGFTLDRDSGPHDWARAFGRRGPALEIKERLALATVTSASPGTR